MATSNINQPMGARPVRHINGINWNGQTQLYAFSTSNNVAAYKYDLASFDTTNRALALTDSYYPACPLVQTVASDITTAKQRGVIAGFIVEPDFNMSVTASLGLMYRLASTKRYAWVCDDPWVIYTVQEDGQSWTSTTTNAINKTVGTAYTAGSATTGVSGMQMKSSDVQTAAARPFRVLRYTETVNNFDWTASDTPTYAKFDVLLTNSDLFNAAMTNNGA